jgi:hypothetical protein
METKAMANRKVPAMRAVGLILGLFLFGIYSAKALADDQDPPDKWKIDLNIYLWVASIGGTTVAGDEFDISLSDVVDSLDMAFMGSIGGHKGRWLALADIIYLDVGKEKSNTGSFLGQPINTSVGFDLNGTVVSLVGGYTAVQTENLNFDVIFGTRYLGLKTDLTFAVGSNVAPFSTSGNIWDGIVGVRGSFDLSEAWFFSYGLDAGTGESDFTGHARAGFGYQLPKLDVVFGYRYLTWKFASSDPGGRIFDDLDFKGPYAGVKFVFR